MLGEELIVQHLSGTIYINTMDRVPVVNYCLGLLGLLLLQGVLNAEGRSIFYPGECAKCSLFRFTHNENAHNYPIIYISAVVLRQVTS